MLKAGTILVNDFGKCVVWRDSEAYVENEIINVYGFSKVEINPINVFPNNGSENFWIGVEKNTNIVSPNLINARNSGLKIGFTCGAMDVLHAGHSMMLQEAKSTCNYLVVGVQTDPSIDRPEKNKPIMSYEERVVMTLSNRYVDDVIAYNTEDELVELLKILRPDIRIVGADHQGKKFTGYDMNIPVYFNKREHNWSSSDLRKRIQFAENNKIS
ncbi:MAG: adenylyltransferase/cytidyltransferase family protein [Candidatus Hodarchaeales archaeon]|jgi:glycerol-3-phosphate cytidylyltransferase